MKNELVIVIDFGGQYNQLVARRVRECNVYCEIYSYKIGIDKIKEMNPKGIILTGGPNSCYEPDSPTYSKELFELGIPVLGLCYGAQLMQHVLGGKVEKAEVSEYGKTEVLIDKKDSKLFENVSEKTICISSVLIIPMMRCRVVCALKVAMDIRSPTRRFIRVDFPTLGFPTMFTNPALCIKSSVGFVHYRTKEAVSGKDGYVIMQKARTSRISPVVETNFPLCVSVKSVPSILRPFETALCQ